MNLKTLELEVEKLKGSIPKPTTFRDDLFSISGSPHKEVVMSNWFAYFLDSTSLHSFSALFTRCLSGLLDEKTGKSTIVFDSGWLSDDVYVLQEMQTHNRGFLDLLIYDSVTNSSAGNDEYQNAIVIEHKVWAALYNDLDDYFNSVKATNKIGVVLSANALKPNNSNYVNITYAELVSRLKLELGKTIIEKDADQLTYLLDFINNLNRMSNDNDQRDSLAFCLEHGKIIQELVELKHQEEGRLADDLYKALDGNSKFTYKRKNLKSITIDYNSPDISVTIELDQLFSEKKCIYQVWLFGKCKDNWGNRNDEDKLKDQIGGLNIEVRKDNDTKDWQYLLRGTYELEKSTNLEDNLAQDIVNYLESSLQPVLSALSPKKFNP